MLRGSGGNSMTTRADYLLYQALSQFGSGLGSMMAQRKQKKRDQQFIDQMFPNVEPQVDPQQMQLISAITGAAPGLAGAVSAAGNQGAAMVGAKQQAAAQNAANARMREMFKDPQMAAMLKQGMAQAQIAQMMPKQRNIGDMVMSVADGVMIMDPKTGSLNFHRTKKEDITKVLKPGDVIYNQETGGVEFQVPENTRMKSWLSEENRMGPDGIPETRPQIVFENGSTIPVGEWGVSSRSFSIGQPLMSKAERASWREKIEETRRSLREFADIKGMFDPEFLTLAGRARSGVNKIMDQFGVLDLFPGEKERYSDRNEFFTVVSTRANQYIKDITGAQMSEPEARRLLKAIPNVEDNPQMFWDKLNSVIRISESALDQYEKVLYETGDQDAARAASDMTVRTMIDTFDLEDDDAVPAGLPEGWEPID